MEAVLSLNFGSSSVKFALYKSQEQSQIPSIICNGTLKGLPHRLYFTAEIDQKIITEETRPTQTDFTEALSFLLDWINTQFPDIQLKAAGHRVVHGGALYKTSTFINDKILKDLEMLNPLAPLHQPHNIAGIRILQKLYPSLMQVACFDTAFHHTQPRLATLFGLPNNFWQEGIRRYGFHGLSYQYIASQLEERLGENAHGRIIVAHLGHGASMCALKNLKSIATTMGLTALDGLPMGTRCGALDPGVVIYLSSEKNLSNQAINDLLYNKSGLLGLSGLSDDMQDLLKSKNPAAVEAIEYFCYRILRELGALVATLGGVDALIFTGGIGENAALIRQKVCEKLNWLNIEIDQNLNTSGLSRQSFSIHSSARSLPVWVIPTNEEVVIAQEVFRVLQENNLR